MEMKSAAADLSGEGACRHGDEERGGGSGFAPSG